MARYAIYSTNTGTPTARPVLGLIELPDEPTDTLAARIAAQPLGNNEAIVLLNAAAQLLELNSEEDTYAYRVDSTATPPVALNTVTTARYSLQQRQAEYRRNRDQRIRFASQRANFGRWFTESEGEAWFNYLKALQDLPDAPADPENVSWPGAPSEQNGTGTVPLFARLWRRGNTIGSVSKVAGVPVQQLVEYETTSNGYYWKFTDGILLCTHRAQFTYDSVAQLNYVWTFPHAFGSAAIDRRSVHVAMSTRNNNNQVVGISATKMAELQVIIATQGASSNVSIILRSPSNALNPGDFCWAELFAIGRWDN
jgi:hypothetical protein